MKCRLIVLLLVLARWCNLSGQIALAPLPHPEGFFSADNLWRIQIISPRVYSGAQLEATLENAQHQQVFRALLPGLSVPAGSWRPDLPAAATRFEFGAAAAAAVFRGTGRLPYGQYVLCYRLVLPQTNEQLGEFCREESIRPLGPPELLSPADRERIGTDRPLLTWKPPFPPGSVPFEYVLRLVEVEEGQDAAEALQRNSPLLSRQNISTSFLPYPGDARALQSGHRYAWQVWARAGAFDLAATEIWTFEVELPGFHNENPVHYEYLSGDPDNVPFAAVGDTLGLIVDHAYLPIENYRVLIFVDDNADQLITGIPVIAQGSIWPSAALQDGVNYLVLDLKALGLEYGKTYLLEAPDQKERYKLRFLYTDSK